jgi:hypothetical protein
MSEVQVSNARRVGFTAWAVVLAATASCSHEVPTIIVVDSLPSPDGRLTATVFNETGGGAAGYVRPNVVVHRTGISFDRRDRLLVDGSYRSIGARWLGNLTLEVTFADSHGASTRHDSTLGVQVVYRRIR